MAPNSRTFDQERLHISPIAASDAAPKRGDAALAADHVQESVGRVVFVDQQVGAFQPMIPLGGEGLVVIQFIEHEEPS